MVNFFLKIVICLFAFHLSYSQDSIVVKSVVDTTSIKVGEQFSYKINTSNLNYKLNSKINLETETYTQIFNTKNIPSREDVAKEILKYLEEEVKAGAKVNHIMRHTVGLYHGQPGSKDWKRYLSDNMMARDSDFQKAKHIMTIVQNNEKNKNVVL